MAAGIDPDRWLAFVAASLLMGLVPGPGVMAIVATAASSGRRVALGAVVGMAIGNMLAMTLSLAGVGALLAASAAGFAALKLAGAVWLVLLGLWTLRRTQAAVGATPPISPRAAFSGTLAIGTFHPKTIVFFVAFVPQFIRPDRDYASQAALLVATFCGVLALTDAGYAFAAARAATRLRGQGAQRWSQRVGGGVLIAAGVATAAARR